MKVDRRVAAMVVVCLMCVGGPTAYLLSSRSQQQDAIRRAPQQPRSGLDRLLAAPHIVFRHTTVGDDYGKIAVVALADPAGARAVTKDRCDVVYAARTRTVCLSPDEAHVSSLSEGASDPPTQPERELSLVGAPSRARLSANARWAATTSFVGGDSYETGSFSTRTVVHDLSAGAEIDLESFQLVHRGATIRPRDRNYWGVTFATDSRTFYVTVAWSGTTWLAEGDLTTGQITTVRSDAECPSLSPDGTTVVYKKRAGRSQGQWRLASLDLRTGTERLLAEVRNVDDQAAWLDDATVMYGIVTQKGAQILREDVYAVPADGSGSARLLIEHASSPAAVS